MNLIFGFTFLFWSGLITILLKYNNNKLKVAKNILSTIHASFIIISYLFNIPGSYVFYITSSYYALDGFFQIYNFSGLYNFGLIIHHIITVYVLNYLNDPVVSTYLYFPFFLTELSNIPLYIVYHMKATKKDAPILIWIWTFIEALGFFVLRIIIGGVILFRSMFISVIPTEVLLSCLGIYIISIIWLKSLLEQITK